MMTPEQAIELYKANAKMALDIINAAIEGTAKVRRLQFEGEEKARAFQKKARAVGVGSADPQSLMAASQGAAQEAIEKSMHYWGEMFDLIVEIQKRLFTLIEEQMAGHAGRQGGEGRDGDDAGPEAAPERRVRDAGRRLIRQQRVRDDAEGDGRLRAPVAAPLNEAG